MRLAKEQSVLFMVEDNPDDELLTRRALKSNHLSHEIIVARDGQEAIRRLAEDEENTASSFVDRLALILLDLKLPKISGLDVLRSIRSNPKTKKIPVVILTSSNEENDIAESYQLGANSFIQKPVDFERFLQAVKTIGLYWLVFNEPCSKDSSCLKH